ncbi:MAG: hypothetical protein R2733_12745 [Acidimicrobiales bacterium]
MADLDTPVWYASYGSNLLRQRFLAYLLGGAVPMSTSGDAQKGSRDSAMPTDDRPYVLRHQLLFAHSSQRWGGGGVAKLSLTSDPLVATQSRAWRITLGQMEDVFAQENRQPEPAAIDLEQLLAAGIVTPYPTWYGSLLHVGSIDGEPVLTFTGPTPDDVIAPAHASYLRVIADGLAELRGWDRATAADYLAACPGHVDHLDAPTILTLLT